MAKQALATALLLLFAMPCAAQESITVSAPTQPAVEVLSLRTQFLWTRYSESANHDPFENWQTKLIIARGLAGNLSAELQLPIEYRSSVDDNVEGFSLGMIRIGLKHRVWQSDGGATDTSRLSLLYGVVLPGGPAEMTGVGIRPQIGATAMTVHGQHGFTGAMRYTQSFAGPVQHLMPGAGDASLLELDGAYLFRFSPEEFTDECPDGWYFVTELSHNYETNGDNELRITPGILFEGTRFAAEFGVQLPLYHDLRYRPQRELTIVAGLRFLF